MSESPIQRRAATAVGGGLALVGLFAFAAAIAVTLRADAETAAEIAAVLTPWWRITAVVGGLSLGVVGSVIGLRYGNLERYHKDYDPETGRIESSHPFASFAERVSKEETYGQAVSGDPPKKFEPSFRFNLAAMLVFLSPLPIAVLWVDVLSMGTAGLVVLAFTVVMYLGGSVGGAWLAKKFQDEFDL